MTRELTLYPLWQSLNAVFIEEDGWRLPAKFSDPAIEYQAAQANAVLIDASANGKIEVTGSGRTEFLHRMLTNDIQKLAAGEGCHAALLNAAGRLLADTTVHVFEDSILLITAPGCEGKLIGELGRYVITEDVLFSNITDKFALLSLKGPRAEAVIRSVFGESFRDPAEHGHEELDLGPARVVLIRPAFAREGGWFLLVSSDEAASAAELILKKGKVWELQPAGSRTAEILRIEEGVLRYGRDMDENVTLPETGLDEFTANGTKGCYPGQEVVARTQTYGGLHRKMTGLMFGKERAPAAGDKIYAGSGEEKEIGRITSACFSPGLGRGIGLAYVAKGWFAAGLQVNILTAQGEVKAQTALLPFRRE